MTASPPTPQPTRIPTKKMRKLLQMIVDAGGRCSANDDPGEPLLPYCDDHPTTDTFNRANELGFIRTTHDSDSGNSVAHITAAGRAALEQSHE